MRPLTLLLLALLSTNGWSSEPLRVVTTIKPIHSILSGLMAGTRAPELLINDHQLPYGYRLNREQQGDIQQADLLVWVGPELEKFMLEPIQQLSTNTTLLTLLDNEEIKVLPARWSESARDPLFWLDSRNVLILSDELARALIRLDPAREPLYLKNRRQLLTRLAELDRYLEYGYRGLKSGIGMAYHDTLQYFEQAYALKIRGVIAQSPTHPVSGLSLLENRVKLTSGDYSCLLTEQQMPLNELPLLTRGVSLNIGKLDSFGSTLPAGEELYFQLMKSNTQTIKRCLKYEQPASAVSPVAVQPVSLSPQIGGKFMLRDHKGRLFTDEDLLGTFSLIYFGYTFCPDVCPTSLGTLSSALNLLGEKGQRIQPYFITVDPARDTAEVLDTYVAYFHPRLIGLTGTQSMIDQVAKAYRILYERVVDPSRAADEYLVDHASGTYLMAPDGTFITKFA
ncbi:MAG: zinc ABC transporter solute-binding protein, partial [Gammaproteobacteria bacterium]|nr:zinc ABC transporter solute-binding protein [Gammaproteobacteria bacterium]